MLSVGISLGSTLGLVKTHAKSKRKLLLLGQSGLEASFLHHRPNKLATMWP